MTKPVIFGSVIGFVIGAAFMFGRHSGTEYPIPNRPPLWHYLLVILVSSATNAILFYC